MTTIVISLSIASALTAIFAFRFRTYKTPRVLAAYFTGFFLLELLAEKLVIPPGLLGLEVAWVCFAIALLFVVATLATRKLESDTEDDREA